MRRATGAGPRAPGGDILRWAPIRRLVGLRAFQFLVILPTAAVVAVILLSTAVGIEHPSFNFGTVFTWVVWWGALLLSFIVLGRAWCLVCPLGALGEWVQRLSFWRRVPYTAGYHFRWPKPLRNMGLATGLFIVFVWLDNGYGMSNSPRMTARLIVVIAPLAPGRDTRSPAVKVDLPEGIYPIHCSVFCGIGHPSMKARLVVGAPRPALGSRLPWIASVLSAPAAVGFGAWARAGRSARA